MSVPIMYPLAFEISGKFGMFADPMTGSNATSYVIPTISAMQAIVRTVLHHTEVDVEIVGVAICFKPKWTRIDFNSKATVRHPELLKENSACQIKESVLVDPCYQILALVKSKNNGQAHAYQQIFYRRLKREQCLSPASLGRKEYIRDYLGVRKTSVNNFNSVIPSFVADHKQNVFHNLEINSGCVQFCKDVTICVNEKGHLDFKYQPWAERLAYLDVHFKDKTN